MGRRWNLCAVFCRQRANKRSKRLTGELLRMFRDASRAYHIAQQRGATQANLASLAASVRSIGMQLKQAHESRMQIGRMESERKSAKLQASLSREMDDERRRLNATMRTANPERTAARMRSAQDRFSSINVAMQDLARDARDMGRENELVAAEFEGEMGNAERDHMNSITDAARIDEGDEPLRVRVDRECMEYDRMQTMVSDFDAIADAIGADLDALQTWGSDGASADPRTATRYLARVDPPSAETLSSRLPAVAVDVQSQDPPAPAPPPFSTLAPPAPPIRTVRTHAELFAS